MNSQAKEIILNVYKYFQALFKKTKKNFCCHFIQMLTTHLTVLDSTTHLSSYFCISNEVQSHSVCNLSHILCIVFLSSFPLSLSISPFTG